MGPDSKPRYVSNTYVGYGPLFHMTPVKGEPWICSGGHTLVLAGTNDFKGRTLNLSLEEYFKMCAKLSTFCKNWKLFNSGVDFVPNDALLPVDPYFIGLWLGDGSKSTKPGLGLNVVAITKPDLEVRKCCEEIAAIWNIQVTVSKGDRCPTYRLVGTKRGGTNTNLLLGAMRKTFGESLTIPHEYLTSSKTDREALLAGFLDSDGYLGCGYYEIVQKRADYADALGFLARSLGFRVTRKIKTVNGSDYHRLGIIGDASHLPIRISRKRAQARRQVKNPLVTGFSIHPIGDGEYFGVTLDSDGRFLLSDFTVTHD